jgi:hypothetical protein
MSWWTLLLLWTVGGFVVGVAMGKFIRFNRRKD